MKLQTVRQIKNLKNKKVLIRVDFNCPIQKGQVIDDCRIRFAMPTIEYLVKQGSRVVLISHLGRPKGRRVQKYSLKPIYKNLDTRCPKIKVRFVGDCVGEKVQKAIEKMKAGEVVLLENLRFYKGEEKNDSKFAKQLAILADIYINDAFSVCHRKHASVCAITKYLPSYAGFLLEKEVKSLSLVLEKPKHPFVIVMGGVKISTKIGAIKNLIKIADKILVGGALANNFLKARGFNIGRSIYEPKMINTAKTLLKNTRTNFSKNLSGQEKIILPVDFKSKSVTGIPILGAGDLNQFKRNFEILDIGPRTIKLFSQYIKSVKTIVWNGTMGYFEDTKFSHGTKSIAQAILKNKKANIIIGGGETISALTQLTNYPSTQSPNLFVSTGGGAMLTFLSGKTLPGIKPLIKQTE